MKDPLERIADSFEAISVGLLIGEQAVEKLEGIRKELESIRKILEEVHRVSIRDYGTIRK